MEMSKASVRNVSIFTFLRQQFGWMLRLLLRSMSFMVNGSVVNLETQCLPGEMCQCQGPDIQFRNPANTESKEKEEKRETFVNTNSCCKTIQNKKIELEFPECSAALLKYPAERKRHGNRENTDKQ